MTLKLFVKCDRCGELEQVDPSIIANTIDKTLPNELKYLTWTCGSCNAKEAQKSIARMWRTS